MFVDTESNLHLSEAERRAMPPYELKQLNTKNKKQDDDVNVLTTRHYFYGLLIQKAIKRGLARKRAQFNQERGASIDFTSENNLTTNERERRLDDKS